MGKLKKNMYINRIYDELYMYIIIIDRDVYLYNMCVTIRRRLDEDNINIYFYYCAPPIYMCSSRRTHYEHLLTVFISSAGLRLRKPLYSGGLSPPLAARSNPGRRDTTVLHRAGCRRLAGKLIIIICILYI